MSIRRFHNFRDTLLKSQLYRNDLSSHSLDNMAKHFQLGKKIPMKAEDIWRQPIWMVDKYCSQDVDLTYALDKRLDKEQIDSGALERECKLIPILVEMKRRGIKVDEEQLSYLEKTWLQEYYDIIKSLPIHDIWKPYALTSLFNQLGLSYPRTPPPNNNPSFTRNFLLSINHPVVQNLVKARELYRLINTFIKGIKTHLDDNRFIHPDYFNGRSDFGGTVTGRFSSANPNIQQIPQRSADGLKIKSVFVPSNRECFWGRFDYNQQEPRLSMHYAFKLDTAEHPMTDIGIWHKRYTDDFDSDCYVPVMEGMKIDRQDAKTIWLAVSYGMGPRHMSEVTGWSLIDCEAKLNDFHRAVPWIKPMIKFCIDKIQNRGFVKTIGGRRLWFEKGKEYKGMNGLIQGSAADQTKQAIIDIYDQYKMIPLNQVHDELNYEFSEDEYIHEIDIKIKNNMVKAFPLEFPVKIDFKLGKNWMQTCVK
jgi:DNA polymerase-1